ncbi:hypothetical protein GQ44DRAFT_716357 [Phaeosphaeriaceae sp. PMI808]|nr:hypothetical protein GQ44DRAFT_716357 [Phaeosphaeriaceae sp. PMI808]
MESLNSPFAYIEQIDYDPITHRIRYLDYILNLNKPREEGAKLKRSIKVLKAGVLLLHSRSFIT